MAQTAKTSSRFVRALPVGAEVQDGGGVHFRLWAPKCRRVAVQIAQAGQLQDAIELSPERDGHFAGFCADAAAGNLYWFLLDGDSRHYPDPASRFQPDGPHGPSEIIDPRTYVWHDQHWRGLKLPGQVFYELHLGTFTLEGTWQAAERELAELAALGITAIELMPIAAFPGRFNWGYDGVNLYAPSQVYGRPDEMRHYVDAAHSLGLGVILDVVYNHLGPDGNYLSRFSDDYFTNRHTTDWGAAIDFDGPESLPVRDLFLHNAGYWIDEFHLDGLRLDATQNVYDSSADHIIRELAQHARAKAGKRSIVVVAENEPQESILLRPRDEGGFGLDGVWNDDFHHCVAVAAKGNNEAYYSDYDGSAQELLSACKYGYLYQGQFSQWQKKRRGAPAIDVSPWAFITFLENHDQVANSQTGEHYHALTTPGRLRALTALLLLGPGTPMLFQGQEFASSAPFLFFADHHPELASLVHAGRKQFLLQFPSMATPAAQAAVPDPASPDTFHACKLDLSERTKNAAIYQLHRDLLRLRKEEPVLKPRDHRWYDGAVLSREAFILRYFGDTDDNDRLLVVNLGSDLWIRAMSEPLWASPAGTQWTIRWSSEDIRYQGRGTPEFKRELPFPISGHASTWLAPERIRHE